MIPPVDHHEGAIPAGRHVLGEEEWLAVSVLGLEKDCEQEAEKGDEK